LIIAIVAVPLFAQTDSAPGSRPAKPTIPADTEIKTTPSGLKYSVLREGPPGGKSPKGADKVTVHYSGWLTDGTLFDSSVTRGKPLEIAVSGVIKGWTEGLQLMTPGSKFKFTIPPELAYGAAGRPAIPPNSTLIFEVELLSFAEAPPPPKPLPQPDFTPIDESKLTTTASGLKYRVLKVGEGKTPTAGQWVQIHYAAWLTDGTLVKSTYASGAPAKEHVGRSMVKGWNEGLPLMPEGSTFQFVIPPNLAFGERVMRSVPANSTLVFHMELVKLL
jgi:peptidylprolyl isomerase